MDYTCTLTREERVHGDLVPEETMQFKHSRPLGCFYFRWTDRNTGREVIYCPDRYGGKIQAHEAGLVGWLGTTSVDPHGLLATRGIRYPVTESGIFKAIARCAGSSTKGSRAARRSVVRARRSRHLGVESAPKTRSAVRTIRLTESSVSVLERFLRRDATPDEYVFRNVHGDLIDQSNFAELFREAQRILRIRLRRLYATKHTYVSLALTRGVNVTSLSEQTGVALATLLKHYGRFMHTYAADRDELEKMEGTKGPFGPPIAHEAEVIYVSS